MGLEIKGVTVPALLIKLDSSKTFEENLKELEEKLSSTFFKGSVSILDLSDSDLSEQQIEQIENILKKYNTRVLGYKAEKKKKTVKKIPEITEKKSLKIINKTVRSGQRVEYDGDILIIGDVNPDAYIVASGNVIVMGTLRGVVHAGANGDETATVMALKLVPQQLRIGNFFTRSPDNPETPEHPERAYIEDNHIVIERIK
ncbi:septum site-determining protein MinC [Persephonella hydrogeniphila]|uniref:Probable septum site-determining protein MinC n=1 Tax=Persephonella hydrogeniphila TaxID=198703 RepID=A0A285NHJ1_9AQUI|nr:septum site-determining protein MinC [Persephonella hydrogeniphila]SNZ08457.1 septum site-determining protein MinC [Persephonella hydrogeniphila]